MEALVLRLLLLYYQWDGQRIRVGFQPPDRGGDHIRFDLEPELDKAHIQLPEPPHEGVGPVRMPADRSLCNRHPCWFCLVLLWCGSTPAIEQDQVDDDLDTGMGLASLAGE